MKLSARMRLGLWLERFALLHPALMEFSHEYPEGQAHYVNRISCTFAKRSKP